MAIEKYGVHEDIQDKEIIEGISKTQTLSEIQEDINHSILDGSSYYFLASFAPLITSGYMPDPQTLTDLLKTAEGLSMSPSLQYKLFEEILHAHPEVNQAFENQYVSNSSGYTQLIDFCLKLQGIYASTVQEGLQAYQTHQQESNQYLAANYTGEEMFSKYLSLSYPVKLQLQTQLYTAELGKILKENKDGVATWKVLTYGNGFERDDLVQALVISGTIQEGIAYEEIDDTFLTDSVNSLIDQYANSIIAVDKFASTQERIKSLGASVTLVSQLGKGRLSVTNRRHILQEPSPKEYAILDAVIMQIDEIHAQLIAESLENTSDSSFSKQAYRELLATIAEYSTLYYPNAGLLAWIEQNTPGDSVIAPLLYSANTHPHLVNDNRLTKLLVDTQISPSMSINEIVTTYQDLSAGTSTIPYQAESFTTPLQTYLFQETTTILGNEDVYGGDVYPPEIRPTSKKISSLNIDFQDTKYSLNGLQYPQLAIDRRTIESLIYALDTLDPDAPEYQIGVSTIQEIVSRLINAYDNGDPAALSGYTDTLLVLAYPYVNDLPGYTEIIDMKALLGDQYSETGPTEMGVSRMTYILTLAAAAGLAIGTYQRGKLQRFKTDIQPLTDFERSKLEELSQLMTAQIHYRKAEKATFDYLTTTGRAEKIDQFLNFSEDETIIGVIGTMIGSYAIDASNIRNVLQQDLNDPDTYIVNLPALQIDSYITSIDVDVITESLITRILPSTWRPEQKQQLIKEAVEKIRKAALENASVRDTMRIKSEDQIKEYYEDLLEWKYGRKITVKFGETPQPVSGEVINFETFEANPLDVGSTQIIDPDEN